MHRSSSPSSSTTIVLLLIKTPLLLCLNATHRLTPRFNHVKNKTGSVGFTRSFNTVRCYSTFSGSRTLFHQGHSTQQPTPKQFKKPTIHGIQKIIAVASAKGGVGKSTTAVNLALALSSQGLKIGLLDADIYGPSIPTLMNLKNRKPEAVEGTSIIQPLQNYGIKCMSMGFLIEEDTAVIWRGPMVMSALDQLLRQVNWGNLDILVLDLPPGTGDAQLTICQKVPLAGAVIVSTPQDVALADVVRGVNMFKTVDVPILGIIENMSYFQCSNCQHTTHIFGSKGAEKTAQNMNIDFLGEVPIHIEIRETSDSGKPITVLTPNAPQAKPYFDIALKVRQRLDDLEKTENGPKIVFQ